MQIKDSGERTEFASGALRDMHEGKGRTVFLKGTDENGQAWEFGLDEIGKTVFLTREEAEEALEVMKDGNR